MTTLTYNYADSTVVLGPMSRRAEPHTYDLCARHARSMTAPKGWELLRIAPPEGAAPAQRVEPDDLLALAHAVREPARTTESERPAPPTGAWTPPPGSGRRGTTAPSQPADTTHDVGPRTEPSGSINGDAPARPGRPTLRVLPEPGAH